MAHGKIYSDADYLHSWQALSGWLSDVDQCREWLSERRNIVHAQIEPIEFSALKNWHQDAETGNFIHDSGKFFSISGLRIRQWPFAPDAWDQPVILQNEIGFLGFIAKKIRGVLHLLVQAKIEPGNVNLVQLSPTIQATRSNFQRVHGGRTPLYLEYFHENQNRVVRFDQLQSEQGSRFLDKLNRNLIVELEEDEMVELQDDHCWMTIGQIKGLVNDDNLINMDSRSVLSSLDLYSSDADELTNTSLTGFGKQLFESMSPTAARDHTDFEISHWLTEHRFGNCFEAEKIPLNEVQGWQQTPDHFFSDLYNFSIIATNVEIENREVICWTQPMMRQNHNELFGFVTQVRRGILHFLAHLKSEVGLQRHSEIGPTVQCCVAKPQVGETPDSRRFLDCFSNMQDSIVHIDVMQSEEGGRFFHEQNRNMVVQIPENVELELTSNFCWMNLRQLLNLLRHSNYLNIQARSILSLLDINAQ